MNDYQGVKKSRIGYLSFIMIMLLPCCLALTAFGGLKKTNEVYRTPEPTIESIQLIGHSQDVDGSNTITGYGVNGNTELIPSKDGRYEDGDDRKSIVNTRSNSIKKAKERGAEQASKRYSGIEVDDILGKVGSEVGIHPVYFKIIGYSENLSNPNAVGDNGCSFGAYQFNACAGKGRRDQVRFGQKFESCSKDLECSTRMLAEKIRSVYNCNIQDGEIEDYRCLYKHQGVNPDGRYKDKIDKQYSLFFSKS